MLLKLSQTYRLGLITFRSRTEIDQFFQKSGLPPHLFTSVVARESLRNLAPQNEALTQSLAQLQVTADQVLMVSDSGQKLRSAQAAGALQCGVLGGLGSERDFDDADLVLAQPTDLLQWL